MTSHKSLMTATATVATAVLTMMLSGRAEAASCVVLDESRDTLSAEERRGAQLVFEEVLRHRGVAVEQTGCTETWTLRHIRLGDSITVVVKNSRSERLEQVSELSELPGIYDQMVRSLQSGYVNTAEGTAVTRDNVVESQASAPRISADGLWYVRLGGAATLADGLNAGPGFGLGRRWELDHLAIDLSIFNTTIYQGEGGSDGAGCEWIRAGAAYFLDATANHTPYLGASLGLSTQSVDAADRGNWEGTGLNVNLTAGYEFLRASSIRFFTEATLTLPTYELLSDDWTGETRDERTYAPTASLSLGLGWGGATSRQRTGKK